MLFLFLSTNPFLISDLRAQNMDHIITACGIFMEGAHTVFANVFQYLPDEVVLKQVVNLYPELKWLTKKVELSPEDVATPSNELSPSMRLFNSFHPEFDRAAMSIILLKKILANDHEGFVHGQAVPVRLSVESFQQLRNHFMKVLAKSEHNPELDSLKLDALIAFMAIHDLGKSKSFSRIVEAITSRIDADHDRILVSGLQEEDLLAPSFERLDRKFRDLIFSGMAADFNMGQFAQGENVAANLLGLQGITQEAFDFYYAHLVLDVAGASGAKNPIGSSVMMEPVYRGFAIGSKYLQLLAKGLSAKEVYFTHLKARGEALGFTIETPTDYAITRIALLARAGNAESAQAIARVFHGLPENIQALLTVEMNRTGIEDGHATLLYYSPAVIANARNKLKALGESNFSDKGLEISLIAFARAYAQSRVFLAKEKSNGVFTLNIKALAERAALDPLSLNEASFDFRRVDQGADLILKDSAPIEEKFGVNEGVIPPTLLEHDLIFVGMGGGSDGVQASMLAKLAAEQGANVLGVVSVRGSRTASQSGSDVIGVARTIQNHGGEISPGIIRILPESTGSGRFLEHLSAGLFSTLVVVDEENETLVERLNKAIQALSDGTRKRKKVIIGVDTGGDSLYSVKDEQNLNVAIATPDQDVRVLSALNELSKIANRSLDIYSALVVVGVDSPDDAFSRLKRANAVYFKPDQKSSDSILAQYRHWKLDGSSDQIYGKTPLAWIAALEGKRGYQAIPLPSSVVTSQTNPWIPFVKLNPYSPGVFWMKASDHLRIIGL